MCMFVGLVMLWCSIAASHHCGKGCIAAWWLDAACCMLLWTPVQGWGDTGMKRHVAGVAQLPGSSCKVHMVLI